MYATSRFDRAAEDRPRGSGSAIAAGALPGPAVERLSTHRVAANTPLEAPPKGIRASVPPAVTSPTTSWASVIHPSTDGGLVRARARRRARNVAVKTCRQ